MLAFDSGLWEAMGMAERTYPPNHEDRRANKLKAQIDNTHIPKINNPVFLKGTSFVRHVVVSVDPKKKIADVKTVSGVTILTRDVPWTLLSALDESQNALQVVREATEDR